MHSRQQLQSWSDSDWPENDFTLEQNLADLKLHISEHERDEAYGFSVFDADENMLLGSLYLNPVASIVEAYPHDPMAASVLQQFDVCADYWLRPDVCPDVEVLFVKTVQRWLIDAWWFQNVAFGSRRGMKVQRQRYMEAGLEAFAVLKNISATRQFHFHGMQTGRSPPLSLHAAPGEPTDRACR